MNRLQSAIELLKTNDIERLNKQAACLLRLFYKVYFYNRTESQKERTQLQPNIASELLLAETLSIPNELINAVIQSNCKSLSECLQGAR